jgi:hypothetical protein
MTKKQQIPTSLFEGVIEGKKPEKQFYITQSFMKDVRSFLDGGGCGVLLKSTWLDGIGGIEASASMKLGQYLEYILTGALPKDGHVPVAEYMKSAKGTGVSDMLAPYRSAHENREVVLEYWRLMGLEIYVPLNTKPLVGIELTKGRFRGTIDIILIATRDISFEDGFELKKGERICVDLKYSGLGEDKWSVHGWQWTPDQKKYHGTQAKQYHYLTGLPFFFCVVDPGGKYVKFFRIEFTDTAIQNHIAEGNHLYERFMFLVENELLEARPEVTKCSNCVLFNTCASRHVYPHPVKVIIE